MKPDQSEWLCYHGPQAQRKPRLVPAGEACCDCGYKPPCDPLRPDDSSVRELRATRDLGPNWKESILTGAQEQAVVRLRKRKSKVVVKGTVNGEVQVEWTEKDVFNENRVVKATIAQNGMLAETPR